MDAFKIAVKIYAQSDVFGPSEFVPVFHRWIQNGSLTDHLVIDVADYAHVPDGPGSVLVTSEANLYTDRADKRLGLLYARKLPLEGGEGTFADRLRAVISATQKAAALLEQDQAMVGRLKFNPNELSIRIHDRLLAPNTPETFAAVREDLESVAKSVFGSPRPTVEFINAPEKLFEARLKA